MKKQFLLSILMILSLVANADPVEIDGVYYNLVSKASVAEVTSNPNNYEGDVVIPNSVTYDGVEYNVTGIGQSAFASCINLSSVTIPNSVTSIGDFAFSWCSKLTSITIPDGVPTIGLSAFWNCSSLTSVSIPNSVTQINGVAFMGCTSLKSVTIPNSVTLLASGAFADCTSLTSVTIPNSVTYMGDRVFRGCTNLNTISIGSGMKEMYAETFANCTALMRVYCYAESVPNTPSDAFNGSFPEYINLYVPANAVEAYKSTSPWSSFKAVLAIGSEPSEYTLTYVIDGNEYKSYKVEEGAAITPEPAPSKEGYSFSGWNDLPSTMPGYDVTVTGNFTVNKYKLTYKVDGVEYKSYDIEYGASITQEPAPSKEGYTFSGWSDIPATMPAHDVTVTGSFNAIPVASKFKLTYMVNNEVYKSYEIEEGTIITPEPAPSKEGYSFSGWNDLPSTMPSYDVTVTGSFTINKYKLIYKVDGVEYKTYDIEYGTSITPEPVPSKDGFTFSGWSDVPATMPAYDVVVEGFYTTGIKEVVDQDSSVLIYDINGKKVSHPKSGVYIIRKKNGETRKIVIK